MSFTILYIYNEFEILKEDLNIRLNNLSNISHINFCFANHSFVSVDVYDPILLKWISVRFDVPCRPLV